MKYIIIFVLLVLLANNQKDILFLYQQQQKLNAEVMELQYRNMELKKEIAILKNPYLKYGAL